MESHSAPRSSSGSLHRSVASRGKTVLLTALSTASPLTTLFAHPGHAHPPVGPPAEPSHWFVEPDHAVTWLLLGVMAWMLRRVQKSARPKAARSKEDQR